MTTLFPEMMTLVRSGLYDRMPSPEELERIASLELGQWKEIVTMVREQTVSGIVSHAVTRISETVRVPDSILFNLMADAERIAVRSRRIIRTAEKIDEVLSAQGFHPVVMKGPAVAAWYPKPELRVSGDIDLVLNAGQCSQLGLDDNAVVMRVLDDLSGQSNVLFEGLRGGVDHNGSESAVDAGFAEFECIAVVEMQADRKTCLLYRGFDQFHEICVICICSGALGYLEYQRSVEFGGSLSDALDYLHVVNVESADRVSAVVGFCKHFFCCYEWHKKTPLLYKNSYVLYRESVL